MKALIARWVSMGGTSAIGVLLVGAGLAMFGLVRQGSDLVDVHASPMAGFGAVMLMFLGALMILMSWARQTLLSR